MSLYLGKIHYWLFNKILWFENLEEKIIESLIESELNLSEIKEMIENKYEKKLENKNLEEIIDLNNIHGWLQNRIHSSEKRMAAWFNFILQNNIEIISNLEKVFEEQAILAAKEIQIKTDCITAPEIYNFMNNYILDGMPCDRVNIISISTDNLIEWERRTCVHKEIWAKENVDVNIFYNLRNIWIKNFVENINSDFQYNVISNEKFNISYKIK